MQISDSLLQNKEKIAFLLRDLYFAHGYRSYRMNKFEEYDLYANNKDFLVSDQVITFTDTTGKLMALKPDVTLSIIKNAKDLPNEKQKVFYNENVYRVSKGSNSFGEILQTGLECFGNVEENDITEVILLAAESLSRISNDFVLELSNLSIMANVLSYVGFPSEARSSLLTAISEKNVREITSLAEQYTLSKKALSSLMNVLSVHAPICEMKEKLSLLLSEFGEIKQAASFLRVLNTLSKSPFADRIIVDFSVIDDINYYNGIVCKGFIDGIPSAVLSGGQYDHLMQKLQRKSKAIGFAIYTDLLERIVPGEKINAKDDYLNVALPKGRLGEKVYQMFQDAGYECPSILEKNRKLIFENSEKKVRYFWVKPSDVAIYVERGAADIGVAGKDILLEYQPEIYELLDLNIGKCRMAVAGPENYKDDPTQTLKVATKFPVIAQDYYRSQGRDIDIINLNGSIEIAPILGLSDVIVDIVETGTTLKENHLAVLDTVVPISARLIANKSSYKFNFNRIDTLCKDIKKIVEAQS